MKLSLKALGKKTLLVAVAALFGGAVTTVAVFAAIPNSSTGLISACRNNLTGALRAIDAQSGATCGFGSTGLSWPSTSTGDGDSTHSALLRVEASLADPTDYVMDPARSRNIVDAKMVYDTTPGSEGKSLCIKVAFTPEVKVISATEQVGMIPTLDVKIPNQGMGILEAITYTCGSGYNAVAFLNPSSGNANPQSIFFSN